jgi:UPF0271 protein
VIRELMGFAGGIRVSTAVDLGVLKVKEPGSGSRRRVEEASARLGDARRLSETDLDVLALCLELASEGKACVIITDDYAVQNVAEHMGLKFRGLTTRGIRYRFRWLLYCPACGRVYSSRFSGEACTVCGSRLREKVAKRTRARMGWTPGPQRRGS